LKFIRIADKIFKTGGRGDTAMYSRKVSTAISICFRQIVPLENPTILNLTSNKEVRVLSQEENIKLKYLEPLPIIVSARSKA
jgi:hypothetical protein